jgi:hypothetical protein
VPVRFAPEKWKAIKRLAAKRGRDASKEIRAAVDYWIRILEKPALHNGGLICLIAILVRRIEARTGRKWTEDPSTGTFVREGVERLILHFAPTSVGQLTVPPDIAGIAGELITIAENLVPRPGVPEIPSDLVGDDWADWRRSSKTWEVDGNATKISGLAGREMRHEPRPYPPPRRAHIRTQI